MFAGDEISLVRGGDVVCWSKMVEAINALCQLTILDEATDKDKQKGSGCLVQLKLDGNVIIAVLTNHHVVPNEDIAMKTLTTFNYDGRGKPIVVHLDPRIFFRTSNRNEYDYALVGLNREDVQSLQTSLGILPLQLHHVPQNEIYNVRKVHIAQHPHGKAKRFSTGNVREIQEKFILYDAATSAGSSGSPVFYVHNEDYRVLALHKSGGVVTSSGKELANKGVFINIILDHLKGDLVRLMHPKISRNEQSNHARLTSPETVRIGSRIPDKWEKIALASGKFDDKEIANITQNYTYHDSSMKATVMLNDYQRRMGTREDLVSALKEFGELDLAQKVQNKYFQTYKSNTNKSHFPQ